MPRDELGAPGAGERPGAATADAATGSARAPGASSATGHLRAEGVSFAYGDRRVLDDVSLAVGPGEVLGLLGPNGSGKTTLLRCLLAFLAPAAGRVTLDGRDVREIPRRDFARRVAAVPQDMPVDFPLRVWELVQLGRLPYLPHGGLGFEGASDRRAVDAALEVCGIASLADRPLHQLSGGELRRAFVARALAQDTAVVLLDEPTSGLDLRHQVAIARLLRERARQGRSIVVVVHDLNLAIQLCDRVVMLSQGRVVASGPPRTVMRRELVSEIYGVGVTVIESGADSILLPTV
jgi:iron complex transport system ATP-binding protein